MRFICISIFVFCISAVLIGQPTSMVMKDHIEYLSPKGAISLGIDQTMKTTPTQRLDGYVYKKATTPGSQLENDQKRVYEYDSQHNFTLREDYSWDANGNIWQIDSRIVRVFDSNNNLTERTSYFNWNSSNNTFDSGNRLVNTILNNQVMEVLVSELNASQIWENSEKHVYNYNSSNELEEIVYSELVAGQWIIVQRNRSTFDSNGNETLRTLDDYSNGNWSPNNKIEYVHNTNNDITKLTKSNFQNGSWIYEFRYNFAYLANGLEEESILDFWINNSWFPLNKFGNTYDNLLNHSESLLYNSSGPIWSISVKEIYTYNNGFPFSELISPFNEYTFRHQRLVDTIKIFDQSSSQFIVDGVQEYNWTDLLASPIENPTLQPSKLTVFPNPAQDYLQFNLSKQTQPVLVELFSSTGQFITQQQLNEATMLLPKLTNGYYFYRVRDGDQDYSGKFVIKN